MKTLILAFALVASQAHAASGDMPSTCDFDVYGQNAELNITVGENGVYAGRLFVGKTELNPLGACHAITEPGRRNLRCTFVDGKTRYELYPSAEQNGVFQGIRVIVWNGDKPANLTGNCH